MRQIHKFFIILLILTITLPSLAFKEVSTENSNFTETASGPTIFVETSQTTNTVNVTIGTVTKSYSNCPVDMQGILSLNFNAGCFQLTIAPKLHLPELTFAQIISTPTVRVLQNTYELTPNVTQNNNSGIALLPSLVPTPIDNKTMLAVFTLMLAGLFVLTKNAFRKSFDNLELAKLNVYRC